MTLELRRRRGASGRLAVLLLAGAAVAACKPAGQTASNASASSEPPPLAALPLSTSAAPPIAPAPPASALAPAPPVRVGHLADPSEGYAYADRAYEMNSAFGDAPPDYAFDYGNGQEPWVWQGDDQSTMIAEPLPDGGYRYYYYDPGSDEPYLVRDGDYSYGYDNGVLVVVYDAYGRPLPPDEVDRRADLGGRYLARARAVFDASHRQPHVAVAQGAWANRRDAIENEQGRWSSALAANPGWSAYHAERAPQDQAHWADERVRRAAEGARVAQAMNQPQLAQRDWQAAQQARQGLAPAVPAPRPPARPAGPPPPGSFNPPPRQEQAVANVQPGHNPRALTETPSYAGPSPATRAPVTRPPESRPPQSAPQPGFHPQPPVAAYRQAPSEPTRPPFAPAPGPRPPSMAASRPAPHQTPPPPPAFAQARAAPKPAQAPTFERPQRPPPAVHAAPNRPEPTHGGPPNAHRKDQTP